MSVSKFKPIRRVAIGGMAEVLLASQQGLAGFERLVVIKRILSHLRDDQEFVQMFLDEARLAATLQHPNIVETLDVFRDDETYNVALEYISGEDLRYVIGRARKREIQIPVPVACRIVADIASALDYVHNAVDADGAPMKIVHRDVAPSNIILGYSGVAKLIDFGIAKAKISHIYTRPGTLKGKFAYMSPEQIQHQVLDGRSDVFSLSVVLYELLTARRLFKGPSQAAVLQSVMERSITPPSEVVPAVPKELDQIVLDGLARDRDRRIQAAGTLNDRLEQLLGSKVSFASHKQVAEWMKEALKDRKQHRVALEREVVQLARQPEQFVEEPDALPQMFGTASAQASSVPGSQRSSQQTAGSGLSSVSGLVPPAPRQRGWLLILGGAVGTLALVGAIVFGFLLGTDRNKETRPSEAASAAVEATLVVHALPGGAELSVNGEKRPETVGPEGLMVSVKGGSRVKLTLRKRGYQDHSMEITAPRDGTDHLHVHLRPVAGGAAAAVKTARADHVDEPRPEVARPQRSRGIAPRASHPGRSAARPPRSPQRQARQREEQKRPMASLALTFRPAGATIRLDGVAQLGSSPMRFEGLDAGLHTVSVEAAGHGTVNRNIELSPSHPNRLDIQLARLAPEKATFDVVSAPSGAEVLVDGKPRGRAPLLGLEVKAEAALQIQVKLSGYRVWSTRITPSSGRNPTVVATLQPDQAQPRREAPLAVGSDVRGSAGRGRGLFLSRCNSCHPGRVSPKKYTASQWSRYFAHGRHASKASLRGKVTRSELADVKAYLMSVAADVEGATAAGVR